ncbi:MAG: hypothetical protein IJC51_01770, partial [Eggerthellaceae bacterium]|nr:hypothetical protein [Eggerthellaceae bacterium]
MRKNRLSSLSRRIYVAIVGFALVIAALLIVVLALAAWFSQAEGAGDAANSLGSSALLLGMPSLSSLIMCIVGVVLVAVVLGAPVSRLVARCIMQPIDAIDFSHPLDNVAYPEMRPLLQRLDVQQRQLLRQNEELALAETMRRDFSSNVSHEMKTPLQVISGYAELLKNDLVQPDDRQKFAALIYDEAQAMRALINDVLTLSRLDETAFDAQPMPVEVLSVAERMAGRLGVFANKRSIMLRVRGERALVLGSEALIGEMLYNLIENGIRYNHEGGSVTVTVRTEDVRDGSFRNDGGRDGGPRNDGGRDGGPRNDGGRDGNGNSRGDDVRDRESLDGNDRDGGIHDEGVRSEGGSTDAARADTVSAEVSSEGRIVLVRVTDSGVG